MQIYESCISNIYIAEDGYNPGVCGFCGDTDNYLGSYRKGNVQSISEVLIDLLLEYNEEYVREIFKEISLMEKLNAEQKAEINELMVKEFRKRIETIFG
jgi:hypothetical protein|nr:MAG TPA: hypothetical protein [Caudoviricetes sp.]